MNLIHDKINQSFGLLRELDLDLWLIFARETAMQADPTLAMVVGQECTWPSFFAYTKSGEAIAMIGNFDEANYVRSGCFTEVIPYTAGVADDLRKLIGRIDPQRIGLNYSLDNPAADGLTHGMFLLLQSYLEGTPYKDRMESAQELTRKLRSRKLPAEIELISTAAKKTVEVWDEVWPQIHTGMTEIEIGALIDKHVVAAGGTMSFETIVNAADKSSAGHGQPTIAKIAPGDLLHVDFGMRLDGYCSDLQRLVYFRRPGEKVPPPELTEAFKLVHDIITETGKVTRPGKRGWEIDALARQMLVERGFPEYQHALGHQLGRDVHDGGALIGPRWERYGLTPTLLLEADNVFTLELEIELPGIGCVGLEEDVVVTENGARFLCPRQEDLIVV